MDRHKETDLIFLISVEKGFSLRIGHEMIDKMKIRFSKVIKPSILKNAKLFGLNPEFKNELKILHVIK